MSKNLEDLIASVQRGEQSLPPEDSAQRPIGRVEIITEDTLHAFRVYFQIRLERTSYSDGPEYTWTKEGNLRLACNTLLTGLSTHERDDVIVKCCIENGIGRTPCFINSYEWTDQSGVVWHRKFKERFTKG